MKRYLLAGLSTCLVVCAAHGQVASRPLNLKLPPQDLPAVASTSTGASAPGTYYGDHSNSTEADTARPVSELDDGKAHVHGSVTTGIGYSKGLGTTSWNGANLNVSKNYGDSDDPTSVGLSISVMKANGLGGGGGRFGR